MMPGIWLSSTIMSTDAVLLAMWSAALFAFWRLRQSPTLAAGALLGVAVGLAMLAKYAALYLFIGAALAAVFDRDTRRALLSPGGAAALLVAVLVLAPNLIWNAQHGFETVSHTADNANFGAASFDITHIVQFIGDQMAVFGPITALVLFAGIALLAGRGQRDAARREVWLLCFIAPPLVTILMQEIISRAHANWAATAYPAAAVLVASWIVRARWGAFIKAGLALNLAIGLVFTVIWIAPSLADSAGGANLFKRVRGWDQTASDLGKLARDTDASALMFDEREVWHGVDYYGRNLGLPPVRAWRRGADAHSHAEEAGQMQPGEDRRVLIASIRADFRPRIRADFDTIESLGTLTVPLGSHKERVLKLYLASGYHPLPRTAEYEARFEGQSEE
jgi:4-amino-4-deoxy-L-arabinose transferase-like glycosyltransferase